MIWRRETGAGGRAGVFGCARSSHVPEVNPVRAVPLAAFIPSRVPGRGRGAWGGFASEVVRRGQSDWRPAAWGGGGIACGLAPGGGRNAWRPRAVPLGWCSRGLRGLGGGRPGLAADLPVAQSVVDQGEQPPGGGDLGDVLC